MPILSALGDAGGLTRPLDPGQEGPPIKKKKKKEAEKPVSPTLGWGDMGTC